MKKLFLTIALGTLSLSSYSQSAKDTTLLPYITHSEFTILKNNTIELDNRVTAAAKDYIRQDNCLIGAMAISFLGIYLAAIDNYPAAKRCYMISSALTLMSFNFKIQGDRKLSK